MSPCLSEMLLPSAVLMCLLTYCAASSGDRSWFFQKCLSNCNRVNCSTVSDVDFSHEQPLVLRLLQWDCPEECKHTCMWETVTAFHKDGSGVPQFYGKWPFIRLLGVQEPASVIFSLLNGVAHLFMLITLRKKVPKDAPLYYVWHANALVGINAWFWSIVFHSRDFPFTEKMDYFCAISLVLYQLYALCARVLGTKELWKPGLCLLAILSFFTYHVHYLAFVHFDYGYNMKANGLVVLCNGLGWLGWCWVVRKRQPYVVKCALSVIALACCAALELGDFPPWWWTLDAHSLWHAGTAPVNLLWYSFVIDDCLYCVKEERGELPYQLKEPAPDKKKD